jgi:hypothetical protein
MIAIALDARDENTSEQEAGALVMIQSEPHKL